MSTKAIQLGYAPGLPPWHKRRKVRRVIAIGVLVVAVSLLWWGWQGTPGEWVRCRYWHYRCLNHPPMPRLPVYSTDTEIVPQMLALAGKFQSSRNDQSNAVYHPMEWERLHHFVRPSQHWDSGTAFLHGRNPTNGEERLVRIRLDSYLCDSDFKAETSTGAGNVNGQRVAVVELSAEVFMPLNAPELWIATTEAQIIVPWREPFSLFDGIPDPLDGSRFTIRYKSRGRDGTIHGKLNDDGSMLLEVLDGPLVLYEKDGITARPPASQPVMKAAR